MARNLGFLVLILSVIFVCEAMIFHPISESHGFAALELFTPLHGSFGSLEEASEALRTFEILGIGKDLNIREMRSIANLASRDHKKCAEGYKKGFGIFCFATKVRSALLSLKHMRVGLLVASLTEVVWEGGETETKADSNTMKKADKNSVSNTVNRAAAPAAKKSPTVGGTAPSNPGGKAGNKKAANVKDPKQGNIMSFFKKV